MYEKSCYVHVLYAYMYFTCMYNQTTCMKHETEESMTQGADMKNTKSGAGDGAGRGMESGTGCGKRGKGV